MTFTWRGKVRVPRPWRQRGRAYDARAEYEAKKLAGVCTYRGCQASASDDHLMCPQHRDQAREHNRRSTNARRAMRRVQLVLGVVVAACSQPAPPSACQPGSYPWMVLDGERCRFDPGHGFATLARRMEAPVLVEEPSHLAIEMPPRILVARCAWQIEPLSGHTFLLGATDTTTITGATTVLFEGEVPRNLHAPNTYRDGDRCYSLNVLHVDGTRVPVECPTP